MCNNNHTACRLLRNLDGPQMRTMLFIKNRKSFLLNRKRFLVFPPHTCMLSISPWGIKGLPQSVFNVKHNVSVNRHQWPLRVLRTVIATIAAKWSSVLGTCANPRTWHQGSTDVQAKGCIEMKSNNHLTVQLEFILTHMETLKESN